MALQHLSNTKEKSNFDLEKELKVLKAQLAVLEKSEQKIKKAEEEIKLLQELTLLISSSENFNLALDYTLSKICAFTGWEYAEAWIPDLTGEYLECTSYYQSSPLFDTFKATSNQVFIENGKYLVGKVFSTAQASWIHEDDLYNPEKFYRALNAKQSGLKSALAIPITSSSETLAIVVFYMLEPMKEDLHFVSLVSTVTSQLGNIIKRKKAEDALRRSEVFLKKQNFVLRELSRSKSLVSGNTKEAFEEITKSAAETLNAERVSIWLFNPDKSEIICSNLYELSKNAFSFGEKLIASKYPKYFEALKQERVIDAHYAISDPRTYEFATSYLSKFGIRSMLDAPVLLRGEVVGVICHEHAGKPKVWSQEEINFAGSIADMISLILEGAEKESYQKKLKDLNENLELTIRERTSEILEKNEELKLFKHLINQSSDAIFLVNVKDGKFLDVNLKACENLGYSYEEMLKKSVMDIQTKIPNVRKWNEVISEIKEKKQTIFEGVHRRKDGKTFPVELNIKYIHNEGKEYFVTVGRDITERKKVQELLVKNEESFRLLFDNNPNPMLVYDLETLKIIEVNVAAIKTYGYTREEFLELTILDIRPKEDIPKLLENLKLKRNNYECSGEWRHVLQNGKIINVLITSHTLNFKNRESALVVVNDITEQKKIEKVKSELAAVVEHSLDGIIGTTIDGIIYSWNPGAERIYGYKTEEMIGKHVSSLMLPSNSSEVKNIISKVKAGVSIHNHEAIRVRKDGKQIYISADISPIKDSAHNITGISAIIRDVSDIKMATSQLKEIDRKLKTLINNLPGIAFRCANDHSWTMEFISEGAFELTGYNPDELIDNKSVSYNSIIHPEDRKMVWDLIQEAVSKNVPYVIEYRIKCKSLSEKWVWEKGVPVFSKEGKLQAIEGFITDITERKKTEDLTTRLASIFQNSNDAIFIKSQEGRIISWNPAAERIYGYAKEDVLGKHFSILIPTEIQDEVVRLSSDLVNNGNIENFETVRLKKDGTRINVSLTISILKDREGKIIGSSVIAKDITKSIQLKKELELARKKEIHYKDLKSLEEILNSKSIDTISKLFGFKSIKESFPKVYDDMLRKYIELLNQVITLNEIEENVSSELIGISRGLGNLKASPQDIVELHTEALKAIFESENGKDYLISPDIVRRLSLELMSHLASYYRKSTLGVDKATKLNKGIVV